MKREKFDDDLLKCIRSRSNDELKLLLTQELARQSDDFGTLLHYSAKNNNDIITEHLIKLGAQVDERGVLGYTPIALAIRSHSVATVKVLFNAGANISIIDVLGGRNAWEIALEESHRGHQVLDIMKSKQEEKFKDTKKLAESLISAGCNAFHAAVFSDISLMNRILERGVSINSKGARQRAALHAAVALDDSLMAEWVLDSGGDINALDKSGVCPLTVGAECGNKDSVKILLERGADLNIGDRGDGRTPLYAAFDNIKYGNNEANFAVCVKLLLQHNALPRNPTDDDESTMLDHAFNYGMEETAKILGSYIAILVALGQPHADHIISCREETYEEF